MKILPKKFDKKGFTYKQIKRDGMKAIYEQSKAGQKSISFEVIKIGKHDGYDLGASHIDPAETYPGSSQWGISGWTHLNLQSAEARFKKL